MIIAVLSPCTCWDHTRNPGPRDPLPCRRGRPFERVADAYSNPCWPPPTTNCVPPPPAAPHWCWPPAAQTADFRLALSLYQDGVQTLHSLFRRGACHAGYSRIARLFCHPSVEGRTACGSSAAAAG